MDEEFELCQFIYSIMHFDYWGHAFLSVQMRTGGLGRTSSFSQMETGWLVFASGAVAVRGRWISLVWSLSEHFLSCGAASSHFISRHSKLWKQLGNEDRKPSPLLKPSTVICCPADSQNQRSNHGVHNIHCPVCFFCFVFLFYFHSSWLWN